MVHSFLMRSRLKSAALLLALATLLQPNRLSADVIPARHKEGPSHGFLVIRTLDGKTIAVGALIQVARPARTVSRLTFHFKDGSIHDETTEFSQHGKFKLLSDHLIQKGPSFKVQLESSVDASSGQVTIHSRDEHGKEKSVTEHLKLPPDVSNGIVWSLLKNIDPNVPQTTVSMVSASPKPRLVKLHLVQQGQEPFSVAGSPRKVTHFVVKIEITGVAGLVAPLVGKKPPDTQTWILGGTAPTFVKSEGPLFDGGPIWRIEPTNPVGPQAPSSGS